MAEKYTVLSPWSEADVSTQIGLSKRLDTLNGRKIGLFANFKGHSVLILKKAAELIAKIYPDAEFNYITYRAFLNPAFVMNVSEDLGRTLKVRIDAAIEAGTYNIGALTGFNQNGFNAPGFAMTSSIGGFSGGFMWS